MSLVSYANEILERATKPDLEKAALLAENAELKKKAVDLASKCVELEAYADALQRMIDMMV